MGEYILNIILFLLVLSFEPELVVMHRKRFTLALVFYESFIIFVSKRFCMLLDNNGEIIIV